MSCKHREAQAVQSFGIRDNRALQIHPSDWKLLLKPADGLRSKTESYPDAVYGRKHVFLWNCDLVYCLLSLCEWAKVRGEGWGMRLFLTASRRGSQLLKCVFKKTNYKIVYPTAHGSTEDPKCVALGNPSCLVCKAEKVLFLINRRWNIT